MTIGQLVETLMGKACAIYGGYGDCTAFINKGPKYETFGRMLKDGVVTTLMEIKSLFSCKQDVELE